MNSFDFLQCEDVYLRWDWIEDCDEQDSLLEN